MTDEPKKVPDAMTDEPEKVPDAMAPGNVGASVDESTLATIMQNPMAAVMEMMNSALANAEQAENAATKKLSGLHKEKAEALAKQQALATRVQSLKISAKKIVSLEPQVAAMEQSKRLADKQVVTIDAAIKVAQAELKTTVTNTKECEKQRALQQKEADKAELDLQTTAACVTLNLYATNSEAKEVFAKMCNENRIVTRSSMIHGLKDEEVAAFLKLPCNIGDTDRRQFETLFQKI